MTSFESIFAFISIVTSLALTQLITGVVSLIRHADRSTFSITHACWLWLAFVLIIGNWAGLIGVQDSPDWSPGRILLWLLAMISLYAFTALVLPEARSDEPIDLRRFEQNEGRRYIAAHNVFAACALLLIFGIRGIDAETLSIGFFPFLALALGMIALLIDRRGVRAATSGLLAINGSVMTLGLLAALD